MGITPQWNRSPTLPTRRPMKHSKTKALGQHFLRDRSVLQRILKVVSPDKEDLIIEIGAGKGVLTFPLAAAADRVIAVERDTSLISELKAKGRTNLRILEADVLTIRFTDIVTSEMKPRRKVKVVGNLPYVISSQILIKILEEKEVVDRCVFLLQKEVAERITAQPGTKSYSPLSIRFQNAFKVQLCFIVKPESFSPPPKVKSALVSFAKRDQPLHLLSDEPSFSQFLKLAFRHRRKTLFNNLLMAGYPRDLLETTIRELRIDQNARPEQLSLTDHVSVFNFVMENGIIEDRES